MKNLVLFATLAIFWGSSCQPQATQNDDEIPQETAISADSTRGVKLEQVAASPRQWTGLTMSRTGRLFVNFPRWSEDVPVAVAELVDGTLQPFPNAAWNTYEAGAAQEARFVCVQSVVVDAKDRLWVLDPANPQFGGVVARGPRLYQFDLETNELVRSYSFPEALIESSSYLNDVRIDTAAEVAYITDSGAGGLFVVDLTTEEVTRHLAEHVSTQAEVDVLYFPTGPWKNRVHSDGIALSPAGDWLYYLALSGHTLYRVPTALLRTGSIQDVSDAVEVVAEKIHACDGMLFDDAGTLYLGALEENAIYTWTATEGYKLHIQDARIKWADTFTKDVEGHIYFTTTQIHLNEDVRGPYHIFKLI